MNTKSILIIDDEVIIRKSLQQDMLDNGYVVEVAGSGEEALSMLQKGYDLIITDLIMEDLNGLDILEQAKKEHPDKAVFILTGYGELESAITALRLGAEDYILKPYNYEELVLRVERCFARLGLRETVKLYEKLLSICCECKKIRDKDTDGAENEEWKSIEQFISEATGRDLSHGLCPGCYNKKIEELSSFIQGNNL